MKYVVEMISREADYDATVTINAASEDQAKRLAPKFMARPDVWLVTKVSVEIGQLAARDAALDAVLDWATNREHSKCDSPEGTALRAQVVALLAKHGVHPR